MATTPEQIVESLMELSGEMVTELIEHECENADNFNAQRQEIQKQINQMKGEQDIDPAHILSVVSKALEIQFEAYTWGNMIDDCEELSPAEKKWAEQHLTYKALQIVE